MRIRDPRTTGLIFSTGKIVITGAKSEQAAMQAARIFQKAVQKVLDGEATERKIEGGSQETALVPRVYLGDSFKVINIVASTDVGFSIKLESLKEEQKSLSRCHYEPEIFPGLIFKMNEPKIVLLIFTSGKVVLAGGKNRTDIFKAYYKMYPVLRQYRKK